LQLEAVPQSGIAPVAHWHTGSTCLLNEPIRAGGTPESEKFRAAVWTWSINDHGQGFMPLFDIPAGHYSSE
jgi:hypothetical protein